MGPLDRVKGKFRVLDLRASGCGLRFSVYKGIRFRVSSLSPRSEAAIRV